MGITDFFRTSEKNWEKVKDPVCGMSVDLNKTQFKSTFQGKVYGFCSQGCKTSFDADPSSYI